MGITDSIANNISDKLSGNLDLYVETSGQFFGEWKLDKVKKVFCRSTINEAKNFTEPDKKVTKTFLVSNIDNIKFISESKDIKGSVKAAVAGGLLAGPLGAAVGGGLASLSHIVLVKLTLVDGSFLMAKMKKEVYEYLLIEEQSKDKESSECRLDVPVGGVKEIITSSSEDYTSVGAWLVKLFFYLAVLGVVLSIFQSFFNL